VRELTGGGAGLRRSKKLPGRDTGILKTEKRSYFIFACILKNVLVEFLEVILL
jgi:hypothetical protein